MSLNMDFGKNSSTEHALMDLTEHLYQNLNEKLSSIALVLDLTKAFDTVDHYMYSGAKV